MNRLRKCFDAMCEQFSALDEPWESVELVERYRRYWRPKHPRVVLLAESHVHTSDNDRQSRMREMSALPGYPRNYARFVYCLAYGESCLLEDRKPGNNRGTPQFWKLFHSCQDCAWDNAGSADFSPILKKGTSDCGRRVQNKIRLLQTLRERGIWLVDASIMALYRGGKKHPIGDVVQMSWEKYTRKIVADAKPAHVIVVGKGVANSLKGLLPENHTVVCQPNARLTSEEQRGNFHKVYNLCKKHASD